MTLSLRLLISPFIQAHMPYSDWPKITITRDNLKVMGKWGDSARPLLFHIVALNFFGEYICCVLMFLVVPSEEQSLFARWCLHVVRLETCSQLQIYSKFFWMTIVMSLLICIPKIIAYHKEINWFIEIQSLFINGYIYFLTMTKCIQDTSDLLLNFNSI